MRLMNVNIPEVTSIVSDTVERLRKAAVYHQSGSIDFQHPAHLDVMFSNDHWTTIPEMDGFSTRVTDWSRNGHIEAVEAKWYKSAFFPPHYHSEQETITMLKGHATFFLKTGNSPVQEIELNEGDVLVIHPEQIHAGYIHAGTWLSSHFLPPIPKAE